MTWIIHSWQLKYKNTSSRGNQAQAAVYLWKWLTASSEAGLMEGHISYWGGPCCRRGHGFSKMRSAGREREREEKPPPRHWYRSSAKEIDRAIRSWGEVLASGRGKVRNAPGLGMNGQQREWWTASEKEAENEGGAVDKVASQLTSFAGWKIRCQLLIRSRRARRWVMDESEQRHRDDWILRERGELSVSYSPDTRGDPQPTNGAIHIL